jgi:peptide/nickel transport system permease protein
MVRYVLFRVVQGIIAILFATLIIFWMARISGDPTSRFVSVGASQSDVVRIRAQLGLDKPLLTQYWIYIRNISHGDFGRSFYTPDTVMNMISERLPATFKLAGVGILAALIIAIPMGVLAAIKRNKWQDMIAKVVAMFGQSVPPFWFCMMLILFFGVKLRWFPAGGYGGINHYILPTIAIAVFPMAGFTRITRSSMLETLGTDYVRLAKIKGVPSKNVIWKHAFRNALIPVVTFTSAFFTMMLTGSVITEMVFAWPGIGRMAYQAVSNRDFPLIQGIVIIFIVLFILMNLLIDILYVYLDPRIRYVKA